MKNYDKLVVVLGVIVLLIASLGIYYWVPEQVGNPIAEKEDFYTVCGDMTEDLPEAISVYDTCPFYPLIVTPLAVNYNSDADQHIVPLYVENKDVVSDSITRLKEEQLNNRMITYFEDSYSPKNLSLMIADKYWDSSMGALLIEYSEEGYYLGVMATPFASYMSIPVIITDEVDQDVIKTLTDLGVEKTIVCGENLTGFGDVLKFSDVDEISDMYLDFLLEKFKSKDKEYDIDYITITNPRDAFLPEVLEVNSTQQDSGTLKNSNAFPSHVLDVIKGADTKSFTFKIPDDYEYARVKFHFKSLEDPENIEKFADNVMIQGNMVTYARTVASPPMKDEAGNIKHDQFTWETVLYDMGGEEYTVKMTSAFHVQPQADYEVSVKIEKLENPYYPMMEQLSSTAPYLTAYHKGMIYGKADFAFAADETVKVDGENLPGTTTVLRNPSLIPAVNKHVKETIHSSINDLLLKLKYVDITDKEDQIKVLTEKCYDDPVYIALVGDTVMLPQYYYRSPHNDPYNDQDRIYGTNCPSDFIYGNIDPVDYSYKPQYGPNDVENDLYPKNPDGFPEVENLVGRITGWDVQDASALIARSIFYEEIIMNGLYNEWKENAAILTGAGLEFQKLPFFNTVYKLLNKHDPMKFPTGEQHFFGLRTIENLEKGGFNVEHLERGQAQRVGYSDEALDAIKNDGILNKLFFPKNLVKRAQGLETINSLFDLNWWKETSQDGSGVKGGQTMENSNIIISNSHAIWFEAEHGDSLLNTMGGPFLLYQLLGRYFPIIGGFRTNLETIGAYSVRDVSEMEFGPSVIFLEGCGSGKIDSIAPENSLSQAFLHAGVNAFISPTTYSAIGGYLDPRPTWDKLPIDAGVGLGIKGYIKALKDARSGVYPPTHFCGYIFEESYKNLIDDDATIGQALRDAKNKFLPNNFEHKYLWTPPLSITNLMPEDIAEEITQTSSSAGSNVPVEKYCTIYQLNLLGDPAFNPYQPINDN